MKSVKLARSRTSLGAVRSTVSQEAILVAAEAVLEEEGFGGFTIEAVAKRARASKPTIYKWWHDKLGLIMDVQLRKPIVTPPDLGSLRAELVALQTSLWKDHWSDATSANVSRSLKALALTDDEALQKYKEIYVPKRSEPYRVVLERARARGELPPHAATDMLIDVIFGFHLWRLTIKKDVSSTDIESLVELFTAKPIATSGC